MESTLHVRDPLGALVTVEPLILKLVTTDKPLSNIKEYIIEAIQHPTQLIQVPGDQLTRYYFKLINTDYTILIKVNYQQNVWKAAQLFENPSDSIMMDIFQQGIRLI